MRDQLDREEALFQAALELERPEQRARYLLQACGEDAGLRRRVESLLQAHDQAGAFLDKPAAPSGVGSAAATLKLPASTGEANTKPVTEKPGDHIGRYKLLQKIGEGGCGVVYMAEQEEPVRRRVALKIIKVGMDTRQVIARFEAERQALAMMDHPNIARVLDAGATEAGRPYFVMDLVRGIRITDFCNENHLSTEERLNLLTQVCHAIQHAHQKGIIHRDIKPSNILVTLQDGAPLPVIIDFGIAKATEQRLTDKTLFTAFEQFIGTPAYMSPEQAEMSRLDIDTRSDIYSLGVLLYELLTGRTPFDPKTLLEAGIDAMRRTIREQEPPRPSTCLSTMLEADLTAVAKQHHAEPLKLISLVRGDLDWIAMKCLEKDRARRYETANDLTLDIERYLHNEPVLARPPSRLYRLQKLARRNKVAFIAGSAVALALIIGLAVSTHLYLLQRKAYQRAVQAERKESQLRREAESARANEAAERHSSELSARQSHLESYAADIYSAFLALQSRNLGRAMDLLERQMPSPGQEDLRGFEWRYLWQRAQGDELLSLPHGALVSCAVFSGNGQRLATASYDGQVRIWDLGSRQVVKTLSGFEQQFGWHYLAFSPDGKWLAGVRQGKLTVWDSNEFTVRFEQPSAVRVITFTPDSTRLVGWGGAGLELVDTANWQTSGMATKIRPGSYPVLAIDRSSKLAAVGGHDKHDLIEVWNIEERFLVHSFAFSGEIENGFVSLAWSPEGRLAAGTWSGRLLLIDGRSGEELASAPAHAGCVFGLAFAADGSALVTAGHDQLIHLWSLPDPEKRTLLKIRATLKGHRDEIWSLAFSPDSRWLSTAGKDGTAKIWSLEPKPAPVYITNFYVGEFSADGKSFVTMSEPESELTLHYRDVANPGVHSTKTLPVTGLAGLARSVLSSDAKLLGVGRNDGTVEVWSLETDRLLPSGRLQAPGLSTMAFAGNGKTIALATGQGTVELWNLRTGQSTRFSQAAPGRIKGLRFSSGGRFLLAEVEGRAVEWVWEVKTGTEFELPKGVTGKFYISPDDKTLAAPTSNYSVTLWDLASRHERAALKGHRWTVSSMAFSPDGKVLATGGLDAATWLWDVNSGAELTRPLRGHLQGIESLAFSADGRTLASASTDHTVKFWHVATGRELFSITDASKPS